MVDGPRTAEFETDRQHCIRLASTYDDGAAQDEAVVGAVVDGVNGAVENDLEGALVGAALGGAFGELEGGVDLDGERREVLIRCMQNRGHNVISRFVQKQREQTVS